MPDGSTTVVKNVNAVLEFLKIGLACGMLVLIDTVEPLHAFMDGERSLFLALKVKNERFDGLE
jgi:hypothetical protein